MSFQERPEIEVRPAVMLDLKEQTEIAAKIERTTLPIDKMTDLIIRMHGCWCLPEGKNRKGDDVGVIQKWIRLCQGYLKSCDSLEGLKKEGAVRLADVEPLFCRYYIDKVYERGNGRDKGLAELNRGKVQAAKRAFEALIGDGKVQILFGDPSSAKDLWYKCLLHQIYHILSNNCPPYTQIFPDQEENQ